MADLCSRPPLTVLWSAAEHSRVQPSFCRLQWHAQNATHSTMPPAPCALPPSQPRRPRSLGCSICLYLVLAISRMLDSSTLCLGISLRRAHPKVDNLTCACMQPLACQLVRLNLHANGDPKFACKVVVSPVSCQVVTADRRQALDGCFLSTACLVLYAVQARAHSQQLALHARACNPCDQSL